MLIQTLNFEVVQYKHLVNLFNVCVSFIINKQHSEKLAVLALFIDQTAHGWLFVIYSCYA